MSRNMRQKFRLQKVNAEHERKEAELVYRNLSDAAKRQEEAYDYINGEGEYLRATFNPLKMWGWARKYFPYTDEELAVIEEMMAEVDK